MSYYDLLSFKFELFIFNKFAKLQMRQQQGLPGNSVQSQGSRRFGLKWRRAAALV